MKEKTLIVGSGGREHAMGRSLYHPERELLFVPGNGGTEQIGRNIPVKVDAVDDIVVLAEEERTELVLVGPELPLSLGLVDKLTERGINAFGPTEEQAKLETSKRHAKRTMVNLGVPTAGWEDFEDFDEAVAHLENVGWKNIVVKADGLAAGKGVIVPDSEKEAKDALTRMLVDKEFGAAGEIVLLEERMSGPEVSVFAFCDGKIAVPLIVAQDYKRQLDGNKGPNTGGMGSFAPSPLVDRAMMNTIQTTILNPMVEGTNYKGVLYAGLMLTEEGPKVVEFNVRLGDPEFQAVSMEFTGNLGFIAKKCVQGAMHPDYVRHRTGAAVCVVLAAENYPESSDKGTPIIIPPGIAGLPHIEVFHAGTMVENGQLVTNGGRILGVTAHGVDLAHARQRAYEVIGKDGVHFANMQFRRDIGIIYK